MKRTYKKLTKKERQIQSLKGRITRYAHECSEIRREMKHGFTLNADLLETIGYEIETLKDELLRVDPNLKWSYLNSFKPSLFTVIHNW